MVKVTQFRVYDFQGGAAQTLTNLLNWTEPFYVPGQGDNRVYLRKPEGVVPQNGRLNQDLSLLVGHALARFSRAPNEKNPAPDTYVPIARIDDANLTLLNTDFPAVQEQHEQLMKMAEPYLTREAFERWLADLAELRRERLGLKTGARDNTRGHVYKMEFPSTIG